MVGTREDERRIPDLIHRTLEAGLDRPGLRGRIQSLGHYVRSQLLQQNVQTAPAGTLSFLSVQHAFSPPPQGLLIPARRPKMASDRKYMRLGQIEAIFLNNQGVRTPPERGIGRSVHTFRRGLS